MTFILTDNFTEDLILMLIRLISRKRRVFIRINIHRIQIKCNNSNYNPNKIIKLHLSIRITTTKEEALIYIHFLYKTKMLSNSDSLTREKNIIFLKSVNAFIIFQNKCNLKINVNKKWHNKIKIINSLFLIKSLK